MKASTKVIRATADKILNKLLQEGVVIQRYDAYSTNSVYLKFDCGLCNTLRIGDHKGKEKLNYMFMVDVEHTGQVKTTRDNFTQYTYAPSKKQINKLVKHILAHRQKKINGYGSPEAYREAMKIQYVKNKTQKGFWMQAEFVKNNNKEMIKC
ncbi:hypothetical protein [Carnobacterium divergens]|uniref:hypothetical protein n=1 Tax=Carnobacterium divergens TaxID=2748 RepID=UPI002891AF00|nr:hypothetical protein [Carnobacterium divergens]MDT2011157.1 hypothetical protein [Carnobacterium divergens]